MGGWQEKVSTGCILETVRCKKLILDRVIGWGCSCAKTWCDLANIKTSKILYIISVC